MRNIAIAVLAAALAGGPLTASAVTAADATDDQTVATEPGTDQTEADPGERPDRRASDRQAPDRTRTDDGDRPRHERLELRCKPLPEREGVGCRWSPSRHPAFAAYELWRGTKEGGREVIGRFTGRDETWHLDTTTQPDQDAVYVVRVLDARGETIGRSNAARVGPHARRDGRPGGHSVRPHPRLDREPGRPLPLRRPLAQPIEPDAGDDTGEEVAG